MIFVFTGSGKGKTTAALGMGLRAVGAGSKVLMIQFLKTKDGSSENKIIKEIKNFDIRSFGRTGFFLPYNQFKKHPRSEVGISPISESDLALAKKGWDLAKEVFGTEKYQLLILDEIITALNLHLLNKERILGFIKKYQDEMDIVLTGRNCPKEIIEMADLVTRCQEVKHYYQKGQKARMGIEY